VDAVFIYWSSVYGVFSSLGMRSVAVYYLWEVYGVRGSFQKERRAVSRFYTIEEKRPRCGKWFLFLKNCKLYFGKRGKYTDFIGDWDDDFEDDLSNAYYYKLLVNGRYPCLLSERTILTASQVGAPLIDGWFYYPSTKGIVTILSDNMVCEISTDQSPPEEESDGLAGFRDYWRRKESVEFVEAAASCSPPIDAHLYNNN